MRERERGGRGRKRRERERENDFFYNIKSICNIEFYVISINMQEINFFSFFFLFFSSLDSKSLLPSVFRHLSTFMIIEPVLRKMILIELLFYYNYDLFLLYDQILRDFSFFASESSFLSTILMLNHLSVAQVYCCNLCCIIRSLL